MTELLKCLVCGSTDLTNYLNLGDQPLANSFPKREAVIFDINSAIPPTEQGEAKFPLRVNYCNDCSHSQLSELVDPTLLFEDYLYVSGTSQTLKDHFAALARDCAGRIRNSNRPTVLSIGCNDATDLQAFQEIGFSVLGCDPAENLRPLSSAKGISVIVDFWDDAVAEVVGKFDVILGCNVLAHNYDPVGFLKACKLALAPEGIVVIEFPLWTNSVKSVDVGQVYHEHLNYISLASIAKLAEQARLRIDDILEFPDIHGGTVRVVMNSDAREPHCSKFRSMLKTEKVQGFHDLGTYTTFAENVNKNIFALITAISVQKQIGYTVCGFGAAAKTSTILNSAPGFIKIDYVVDDAPMKVGRYIPGSPIPILPTDALKDQPGLLAIVIFAHNFKDEIIKKIKAQRQVPGDIIINVVPGVSVEDLY